jgi:hypothetical protein
VRGRMKKTYEKDKGKEGKREKVKDTKEIINIARVNL